MSQFEWHGYAYHDIDLSGKYDGDAKTIVLSADSDDSNALFDLSVDADLNEDLKDIVLACNVDCVNLSELKLVEGGYSAGGKITSELSGKNLDDADGFLSFENMQFKDSTDQELIIEKFDVKAHRSDVSHEIAVNSDFLNGSIDGNISTKSLVATLQTLRSI